MSGETLLHIDGRLVRVTAGSSVAADAQGSGDRAARRHADEPAIDVQQGLAAHALLSSSPRGA